jgi:hypothetical protein
VWRLKVDDYGLEGCTRFRNAQQRNLFPRVRRAARRAAGWRGVSVADAVIDATFRWVLEPLVVSRLERKRRLPARNG